MVHIDIEYTGDLNCKVVHRPSGNSFMTDAPLDNNGKAEYISPTDLTAAALGSCILTIMGIRAKNTGIDITGSKITVAKEMIDKPIRRISKLYVDIKFPSGLADKDYEMLKRVVDVCPVTKSLMPEIEIIRTFGLLE